MRGALLSVSHGDYDQILDIGAPSMCAYADRWGYDAYISPGLEKIEGRGESWSKIPAALALLETYDEVLILDADTVVMKPEVEFPWVDIWNSHCSHGIVIELTAEGWVPSTGVWGVTTKAIDMLQAIWDFPDKNNGLWAERQWMEQSAYMEIMGYDTINRPVAPFHPAELLEKGCYALDNLWNVTAHCRELWPDAIVRHATPVYEKQVLMRQWAEEARG